MDVDSLYAGVTDRGVGEWQIPGWTAAAIASRVAAHQYRIVIQLLNEQLSARGPRNVLDWGCGSAIFSYVILGDGHHVWAIDPQSPPMAKELSHLSNGRFTYTKATEPTALPYPDDFFDVVLSNGCLEHVGETGGEDAASLQEVVRILKPGGAFVCTHLPNEGSYIEAIARGIQGPVHRYLHRFVYAHNFLYSQQKVAQLSAECGLEMVSFEVYGALPRNPLSILPSRLRDSNWFVESFDRLDDAIAARVSNRCQNIAWVGIKPFRDANEAGRIPT